MKIMSGRDFARAYRCSSDYRRLIADRTVTAFEPGDRITYGEYEGVVREHYDNGMYEVSLPGGFACIDGASLKPLQPSDRVPPAWLVVSLRASQDAECPPLVAFAWTEEFRHRLENLVQLGVQHTLASASIHLDDAQYLPVGASQEFGIDGEEIVARGQMLSFSCTPAAYHYGGVHFEANLGAWPALCGPAQEAAIERQRYFMPTRDFHSPKQVNAWLDALEAAQRPVAIASSAPKLSL